MIRDVISRAEIPRVIHQFTPNWFTVTMGTGVLALALNQFPGASDWPAVLRRVPMGLWLLDMVLFAVFSVIYAARWCLCSGEARRIFDHPVASMFFGAIPMGFATIVNGMLAFGPVLFGDMAIGLAGIGWWLDAAMAVSCGVLVPFMMMTRQVHSLERMTAVWLLPIVACEVAAASGALLAPHLGDAQGFTVLMLSYVLWALSVPLAMGVLALLFLRLVVHGLPDQDQAVSGWLALGPIGTGALGLVLLGGDAPRFFAAQDLAAVGAVAFGVGVLGGLLLWGYGLWWLGLAVLKTVHHARRGMVFNLGWWGFTFPLGVYTLATLALARVTHLAFLAAGGSFLVICLAVLWAVVAVRTARGAWNGHLFVAPCLVTMVPTGALSTGSGKMSGVPAQGAIS